MQNTLWPFLTLNACIEISMEDPELPDTYTSSGCMRSEMVSTRQYVLTKSFSCQQSSVTMGYFSLSLLL